MLGQRVGKKRPSRNPIERLCRFELRHHRQREIVAIAAFIAGLQVVAVDRNDFAIRQVVDARTRQKATFRK